MRTTLARRINPPACPLEREKWAVPRTRDGGGCRSACLPPSLLVIAGWRPAAGVFSTTLKNDVRR